MLELVDWVRNIEKEKYSTYSRIRGAFAAFSPEQQIAMMNGRRANPLKSFDFFIRKRNSGGGSLSDVIKDLGMLSQTEEEALDMEDRSMPTIPE